MILEGDTGFRRTASERPEVDRDKVNDTDKTEGLVGKVLDLTSTSSVSRYHWLWSTVRVKTPVHVRAHEVWGERVR